MHAATWPAPGMHGHMAGHMWTMWTKQKQIVHMVHMHAPGLFDAGEVWTMWALWTAV
jgi:hypothetical protein